MIDKDTPFVRTQMLIRKPVAQVFEAFVNPAVTTRFWFTKSSGRVSPGQDVLWEWGMYGFSTVVHVKEVEQNRRILITWDEPPSPVEWLFTPHTEDSTLVMITNWNFAGSRNEVFSQAVDAMGGFSMVLAGLKALLEYGVSLNLVADQYPDGHIADMHSILDLDEAVQS